MEQVRTVDGVKVPSCLYGTAWKEAATEELTELAIASRGIGLCACSHSARWRRPLLPSPARITRDLSRGEDLPRLQYESKIWSGYGYMKCQFHHPTPPAELACSISIGGHTVPRDTSFGEWCSSNPFDVLNYSHSHQPTRSHSGPTRPADPTWPSQIEQG